MNILIDISHPAHVHFFKHAIRIWEEHGHRVKITSRDKDVTLDLLDSLKIPHLTLSKKGQGYVGLTLELIQHESHLMRIAREFDADVILEIGGTFIVHAGKLLGIKTIVFSDTEHAKLSNLITFPFATLICTPDSYHDDLGIKHHRYAGYQELAYLHPNRFQPNPETLSNIKVDVGDPFFILRFVSWGASHDFGLNGLQNEAKIKLVKGLNQFGKVLITSEGKLPEVLEHYKISISPMHIHDLMFYANMYIGEGATMATEAAILGTPSVYINPLSSGNLAELIQEYKLIYHFPDSQFPLEDIFALAENCDLSQIHLGRRDAMLTEKIDVTAWMVEFVEALDR